MSIGMKSACRDLLSLPVGDAARRSTTRSAFHANLAAFVPDTFIFFIFIVTRSLQGMVLQSIEQVADAISRTSTTKGLRVVTEIATKVYERGLEASQKLINYPFIQHDEDLPKQNYYTANFRS